MPYPLNPRYGKGIFRRRIALVNYQYQVNVELEDCNHAFRLQLFHDGAHVTDIQANALRYPLSVCSGAADALAIFISRPLIATRQKLRQLDDHRQQCSHLHDMLGLAMAQALRNSKKRVYDITLDDFDGPETNAKVLCDGKLVHDWRITTDSLVAPARFNGKPLFKGFAQWANTAFNDDELEAAFVIQMGAFVAKGRQYDIDGMAGETVAPTRIPLGSCYAYQEQRVGQAIRCADSSRDFTENPEQLLRFV
jgi:hypothetical protein